MACPPNGPRISCGDSAARALTYVSFENDAPSAACACQAATCAYVRSDIVSRMAPADKPLVWLHGEVKTPPFSAEARIEAGVLLRQLQRGVKVALPHSRPMPTIGVRCMNYGSRTVMQPGA